MNSRLSTVHGLVIGLGSIGNRHLRNLQQMGVGRLSVVRRPKNNPRFRTPHGVQQFCGIAEAVREQPDFAVICTPSSMHAEQAIKLLEIGIPCLIEKPLICSQSQHEQLSQLSHSCAGKQSAIAYCMRFHEAYAIARKMIAEVRLGQVRYAKAWFEAFLPAWHPWEDYRASYAARSDLGGGVSATLDHEIDFLNWALGIPVESHTMKSSTGALEITVDDVAHVVSRHKSGVTSQLCLSYCRKPSSRGFEFICDRGTLTFHMERQQLIVTDAEGKREIVLECSEASIETMYVDMLREFVSNSTPLGQRAPSNRLAMLGNQMKTLGTHPASA